MVYYLDEGICFTVRRYPIVATEPVIVEVAGDEMHAVFLYNETNGLG